MGARNTTFLVGEFKMEVGIHFPYWYCVVLIIQTTYCNINV